MNNSHISESYNSNTQFNISTHMKHNLMILNLINTLIGNLYIQINYNPNSYWKCANNFHIKTFVKCIYSYILYMNRIRILSSLYVLYCNFYINLLINNLLMNMKNRQNHHIHYSLWWTFTYSLSMCLFQGKILESIKGMRYCHINNNSSTEWNIIYIHHFV